MIINNEHMKSILERIGYVFKNPDLLKQAFTRKSYTEEHKNALHNEVLEFYGDKVLDFIIIKKMSKRYGHIGMGNRFASDKDEGELTEIKKKLVCREMLASKICQLGFQSALDMSASDYMQRAWRQSSVQEDLFEAILGAVATDSDWNVDALTKVVDRMLNPGFYFENGFGDEIDYMQLIQQWCQKKHGILPKCSIYNCVCTYSLLEAYHNQWGKEKPAKYECHLTIGTPDDFKALGETKNEARLEACKKAYQYLETKHLLVTFRDEIGEPDIDRAINQLQELYQKGYISEPRYEFSESHDANGNPIWECHCYLESLGHGYIVTHASKKQAKKIAAYQMVWLYLGEVKHDEA